VEADAEALPFRDGEFDVVTSAVGAIFAPDHQRAADELLRVCRPGGTVGMIALVPSGLVLDVFDILERYSPARILPSTSPLLWGYEEHVRELFGDRVEWLQLRRKPFVLDRFADPAEFRDFLKANHPLVVGLYRDLGTEPARVAALDRDLVEASARWRHAGDDGPPADRGEYLLIVARKHDEPRCP
jgi:2-polyprenyl-6-hydroxyphenyl methylase/3-demethylubiquinone-9 3-methyltransferase